MSPFIGLMQESECLDVALHARDSYTGDHCKRVEKMCMTVGRSCSLDINELTLLSMAAKLHDIGKIGIADRILLKPANLEPEEWEVMKNHAALGQEICTAIPHKNASAVAFIIRHHHERFDGKGYPDGLSGENIPVAARIITLIDGYDAMTSTRPYQKARSHDVVMSILASDQGARVDPYIFSHFEKTIAQKQYRAN